MTDQPTDQPKIEVAAHWHSRYSQALGAERWMHSHKVCIILDVWQQEITQPHSHGADYRQEG